MNTNPNEEMHVLQITLHGALVGYLAGFKNGRLVLHFADEFRHNPNRPTFTLMTHPTFPGSDQRMSDPWVRHKNQQIYPVFFSLLPRGALSKLIAESLQVDVDNSFHLLACLGEDLPGAIIATPMKPDDVPDFVLSAHGKAKAMTFDKPPPPRKTSCFLWRV